MIPKTKTIRAAIEAELKDTDLRPPQARALQYFRRDGRGGCLGSGWRGIRAVLRAAESDGIDQWEMIEALIERAETAKAEGR
ncbi:MAG TPA: hypothetical protein VM013_01165 [Dehalococcoidia bacterium]|nr:hypothetical protein [Dehalococcoidia bacterium]